MRSCFVMRATGLGSRAVRACPADADGAFDALGFLSLRPPRRLLLGFVFVDLPGFLIERIAMVRLLRLARRPD
jgi:hypothetical protein